MDKLFESQPKYVEAFIPDSLEHGVIYISEKYNVAIHLCACGCGGKTVTPIGKHGDWGWSLTDSNGAVTLRPSIGNFSGESPYHAHYYITDNKIEWL